MPHLSAVGISGLQSGEDVKTDVELNRDQEKLFQPGCFVLLRPESKHPDAGRVGKIISRNGMQMLVEFFSDDLIGKSDFSIQPRWLRREALDHDPISMES